MNKIKSKSKVRSAKPGEYEVTIFSKKTARKT